MYIENRVASWQPYFFLAINMNSKYNISVIIVYVSYRFIGNCVPLWGIVL